MNLLLILSIIVVIIILLILMSVKKKNKELLDEKIFYNFGGNKYKPLVYSLIYEKYDHLPYIYGKEMFTILYTNNLHSLCDIIMMYNYLYYYGGKIIDDLIDDNYDCVIHDDNKYMEILMIKPKHIITYKILMLFEHIYRLDNDYALYILTNNMFIRNILNIYKTDKIKVISLSNYEPITIIDLKNSLILTETFQKLPQNMKTYLWNDKIKYHIGRCILDIYKDEKISLHDVNENRKKIYNNFKKLIFNNEFYYMKDDIREVQFNIHRIWITDPNNPKEMNIQSLKRIIDTSKIYENSYYPWKTILWINTDKIYNTIEYLKNNSSIDIRLLKDDDIKFAKKIYDSFMVDKLYASASDIVRINIIYIYGGIYLDTGIDIFKDITNLYLESDRIFYYDGDIDIGIQSCKKSKNDHLYLEFLTFLDNKGWRKYDYIPSLMQIIFTGREYIQLLLETRFSNSKVLLLYNNFCIDRSSMNSWILKWIKKKTDLWKL